MQFAASLSQPPIGGLIILNASKTNCKINWGKDNNFATNGINLKNVTSIARYLALSDKANNWFGNNVIEESEVNHWISFSIGPLSCANEFSDAIAYMDKILTPLTYFVGNQCTLADISIFSILLCRDQWHNLIKDNKVPVNLLRWFSLISSLDFVKKTIVDLPNNIQLVVKKDVETVRKDEGKFVELPGAEMGKVVVRFPPEASGYLHIGHAKAALLNQYYKEAFNGKLIMRFDDTNPAKEKEDFENAILEDLEMLQVRYDEFSHTSNHFDILSDMCETLIKNGSAYVDDTDPEIMKNEREQKIPSKNRDNSVEINMKMWSEMLRGTEYGQKCCVRAKIDMSSLNGCMRDPTIYRCKNEPHPKTGNKYKVYPTYDFACPIVDSIEGVTHCLRTMEYHDRDEQFYWFIDKLGLRKPHIWEYSRLNMVNTVLSKRKLTWFVENGYVEGWDDPRMPTVRGILRRGMTVEALKQFIIMQGSSRSVVVMEWDKIWCINKKVIDPIAPRFTAVTKDNYVTVHIKGVAEEELTVPKHPKNPDVGQKTIFVGPEVIIDQADAEELIVDENVTFINWGNIKIKEIVKEGGRVTNVYAEPNLDDKNYKKTLKITWLAKTKKAPLIPAVCLYYDHIITKPILGKDEDFKDFINTDTLTTVKCVVDPELANLEVSSIIQLQRKGFFICDRIYHPRSMYSGYEGPVVLIAIPDGHSKDLPVASAPTRTTKAVSPQTTKIAVNDVQAILDKIKSQGDKIRDLKKSKPSKDILDVEVKVLLSLKSEYKNITGKDWTPNASEDQKKDSKSDEINPLELSNSIRTQGDKVRELKQSKAAKDVITKEVNVLLKLKSDFKSQTGKDWSPETASQQLAPKIIEQQNPNSIDPLVLLNNIKKQGDKIRSLKSSKANKAAVEAEVKILLDLKANYKLLTGKDWTPESNIAEEKTVVQTSENKDVQNVINKIKVQGDKIRDLKKSKSPKDVIQGEVNVLLSLKSDYKNITGKEWTPEVNNLTEKPPQTNVNTAAQLGTNNKVTELTDKVKEQGNIVRQLKSKNSPKEEIENAVQKLLALKDQYKQLTGTDFPVEGKKSNKSANKGKNENQNKQQKQTEQKKEVESNVKKITRLGLEAAKEENLPEWYSQVLTKGELIEYYDVSGCYILRPWSFAIWENIKDWLDSEIKLLGVKNCYFPIFVSRNVLEKEKTHISDFAPEVAWVTKSGDTDLAEPIAVRPTSETVMYPAYAKWIQSYRDLPIKLNQWNNVVRWEFKHPQPFLRTREFLWQEGHTAFATYKEAEEEVYTILDLYAKVYTDLLAIPVVKGRKTEKEKFAGGDYTLTVEAYISASGRAIQGATSHHLGQNFSKMFEIIYEDPETQEKKFVFQNSWGLTTRTIGVLIMIHADNQGLVLPPKISSIQIVIVPCGITVSLSENDKQKLLTSCQKLKNNLLDAGIRAETDARDNYSPGWKFNHWELKGVPVRVEIGPKDLQSSQIVAVRRDTGSKITIPADSAVKDLKSLLETIQNNLFQKATDELNNHMVVCKVWKDFCQHLDNKNIIQSPFCGEIDCEDNIKNDSARNEDSDSNAPSMGAKSLCIPFTPLEKLLPTDKCIHPKCNKQPKFYTLFGRSY